MIGIAKVDRILVPLYESGEDKLSRGDIIELFGELEDLKAAAECGDAKEHLLKLLQVPFLKRKCHFLSFPRKRESRPDILWIPGQARNDKTQKSH